jgi:hypothetical protein
MFDNNKKVVSGIVALTGTFAAPETAQATWNRSNSNCMVKITRKSSAAEEAAEALNKVRVTKKDLDNIKREARKAINKAKNLRNDALKKVNQTEEIVEAAKEDWETKVITAAKKIKYLESKPEKRYFIKQAEQAQQDAENAKENFENKKFEASVKRRKFQEYEEKLEALTQEQNSKIEAAEMAYKQAQIEQQKLIQTADTSPFAWGNLSKEYKMENRFKDYYGFQVLIP